LVSKKKEITEAEIYSPVGKFAKRAKLGYIKFTVPQEFVLMYNYSQ